ncbi:terminase large subunit [Paenibacillus sp. F4]|uniref:terminase large subunit n=1 Tax=Paenibacillus sp. F4 TaxID=357385 RepID=UPI000C9FB7B8|nr:terminase TerL endonuclease subunit [Paenibacillus sp. F4]PNQ81951.1 terminase large subunit [Paenibacillus sp. F4]
MIFDELVLYSEMVLNGEIVACQKHKRACERFLKDLDRQDTDEFPYVFVEEYAERFLDWMRLFKHRKGALAGQYIEPHIIQKFVFGNIYGWVHRETGLRRFNKAYWQVARKNAKSQSLACVGSYETIAFGEYSSEVYCAATKKKQSKIVWNEAAAMLKGCAALIKRGTIKIANGLIQHLKSESFMEALSKEDGKEGDGTNVQCGIVDEYHLHKTTEFYDVLVSGMIAREQPLLMIITTAGRNLNNPCYRIEYNYVSKLLDPNVDLDNDEYFAMVNELDDGDDIKDERNWPKANPIVTTYPAGIKMLRSELKMALADPEKMVNYKIKNMNLWVDAKQSGYMDMSKWKACGASDENPMPDTTGLEVIAGIDLSRTIDLTSCSFEIQLPDGRLAVFSHSFMPEDTLKARKQTDKMPYDLWVDQGWITITPGSVVDYDFIMQYIPTKAEQNGWKIKEICYDPYNATQFSNAMQAEGYEMIEIRQGIKTLNYPSKNFRDEVYKQNVIHENDPVLGWAMSNAVTKEDAQGNIMLDKSKSIERIDPAAALINAHVRVAVPEDGDDLNQRILSDDFSL